MRIYTVTIGNNGTNLDHRDIKASRAAVAVHRALDRFSDSVLDGATIVVRRGKQLEYGYRIIADVPCDPPGSTKREFVTEVIDNLGKAIDTERAIRDEHPEYKFVSWKRVEVQS